MEIRHTLARWRAIHLGGTAPARLSRKRSTALPRSQVETASPKAWFANARPGGAPSISLAQRKRSFARVANQDPLRKRILLSLPIMREFMAELRTC